MREQAANFLCCSCYYSDSRDFSGLLPKSIFAI